MEEIIKKLGKYFVSINRSSVEWTATGIFKLGKKITDQGQQLKYFHGQTPIEALSKLETELINYYLKIYRISIIKDS